MIGLRILAPSRRGRSLPAWLISASRHLETSIWSCWIIFAFPIGAATPILSLLCRIRSSTRSSRRAFTSSIITFRMQQPPFIRRPWLMRQSWSSMVEDRTMRRKACLSARARRSGVSPTPIASGLAYSMPPSRKRSGLACCRKAKRWGSHPMGRIRTQRFWNWPACTTAS